MDDELLLLCKYRLDTFVCRFDSGFDFEVLMKRLCDNWICIVADKIRIFYSIPGHARCLLRNQCDLESMLSLVTCLNLKFVDVSIESSEREGRCPEREGLSCEGSLIVSGGFLNESGVVCDEDNEDNEILVSESFSNRDMCLLSSNWSTTISHVGQVFEGGAMEFRFALCKYSAELGFKFKYKKNTKERIIAFCFHKYDKGCNWFIIASVLKVNGFFYIRKFCNVHTCGVVFADSKAERLDANLIGGLILQNVKGSSGFRAKDVRNLFRKGYGMDISYKKAWRSLDKAKNMIFGDAVESFKQLRSYVDCALSTHPGSHIEIDVDSTSNKFRRLFVSFHACILGFNFCRPILFIDGTFLKGRFKGVILSATGKDGNQGKPIVFIEFCLFEFKYMKCIVIPSLCM